MALLPAMRSGRCPFSEPGLSVVVVSSTVAASTARAITTDPLAECSYPFDMLPLPLRGCATCLESPWQPVSAYVRQAAGNARRCPRTRAPLVGAHPAKKRAGFTEKVQSGTCLIQALYRGPTPRLASQRAVGDYVAWESRMTTSTTTPVVSPTEVLLTPAQVAALFRVDAKTVTRWAQAGRLEAVRAPGGHRRYRAAQVHALLDRSAGS